VVSSRYSRRELANVLFLSGDDQFSSTILMLKIFENSTRASLEAITRSVQSIESRLGEGAGVSSLGEGPKNAGASEERPLSRASPGPSGPPIPPAAFLAKGQDQLLYQLLGKIEEQSTKIEQQNYLLQHTSAVLKEQSKELSAIKSFLGLAPVAGGVGRGHAEKDSGRISAVVEKPHQHTQSLRHTQSLTAFYKEPRKYAQSFSELASPIIQVPNNGASSVLAEFVVQERSAGGEGEEKTVVSQMRRHSLPGSDQDIRIKKANFIAAERLAASGRVLQGPAQLCRATSADASSPAVPIRRATSALDPESSRLDMHMQGIERSEESEVWLEKTPLRYKCV